MSNLKLKKQIILILLCLIVVISILGISNVQSNKEKIDSLEKSILLANTWMKENFREKGLFVYEYNPEKDKTSNNNNALRQLMSSIVISKKANIDDKYLEMHVKNLDFITEFWLKEDELGNNYIFYNSKSKLGSNAMFLRTLISSPMLSEYNETAEKVATGILKLQNQDGSFKAWFIEPDYEYDEEYLLTFYSGEALLALVEYYEKTGDEKYLDAAKLSADFYIEKYVTNISENYYPAYVPWHTMALNKIYTLSDSKENKTKYAKAIFIMNDKLLEIQDKTDIIGRFYNPETPEYGSPHISSDAVFLEGLGYAYEIAKLEKDKERIEKYKKSIELSIANIISLQYKEEDKIFKGDPRQYIGAFRKNNTDTEIRVDNVQHTIDAFTKVLEII